MEELDELLPQVYGELRRMAGSLMRGQRAQHTLQPTALVHEAYLKLAASPELRAEDRRQVLALAARAMRQVLVDHARGRSREKRGGNPVFVTLSEGARGEEARSFELVALGDALARLEAIDGQQLRVVELRYLAGMTVEEAAQVLGLSPTTVKRETAMARAWLITELS